MYTYKVGDKFINNIYVALHEKYKTGNDIRLYINEAEYDRYDWTIEPEADLDTMMISYAKEIRDKYDKLIFAYSGGTDSHTIYNIFKRANIHIDEIYVKVSEGSTFMSEKVYLWLKENHYDPHTEITAFDNYDRELKLKECSSDNWIWENKALIFSFGISPYGEGIMDKMKAKYGNGSYVVVNGQEKPRLIYRNGRWYQRQMNYSFENMLGVDNIIPFFMEPTLLIKQAHMAKRAVKQRIAEFNLPLYDNDWAEAKWPRTHAGYKLWADALGRHDELIKDASHDQKLFSEAANNVAFAENGKSKEVNINSDAKLWYNLQDNNPAAINHVQGFMNIINSEFGFLRWLKDNGHLRESENQLKRIGFIWSKEYDLGA